MTVQVSVSPYQLFDIVYQTILLVLMDRWVCDSTGVTCSLTMSRICDSTGVSVSSSLTLSTRPYRWCWWTGGFVTVQVSVSPALWHCLPDHPTGVDGQVGLWQYRCQCHHTSSLTLSARPFCWCWWTGGFVTVQVSPALWQCLGFVTVKVSVSPALWHCLPDHTAGADGQVGLWQYRCHLLFDLV